MTENRGMEFQLMKKVVGSVDPMGGMLSHSLILGLRRWWEASKEVVSRQVESITVKRPEPSEAC